MTTKYTALKRVHPFELRLVEKPLPIKIKKATSCQSDTQESCQDINYARKGKLPKSGKDCDSVDFDGDVKGKQHEGDNDEIEVPIETRYEIYNYRAKDNCFTCWNGKFANMSFETLLGISNPDGSKLRKAINRLFRVVPCSACGAEIGSPCRRPSNHLTYDESPHKDRRIAMDIWLKDNE